MSMPEPFYQISRKSDPRIDCYPFFICSEEAVSILRVGETVSVTLALQLFAQLSTQLHCGHGGRPDIIVTRTVIKLRPEPTRPRESSRNHPVSQMHLCHRLLSPGKLWRKCELYQKYIHRARLALCLLQKRRLLVFSFPKLLPFKVRSLLFSIVKMS